MISKTFPTATGLGNPAHYPVHSQYPSIYIFTEYPSIHSIPASAHYSQYQSKGWPWCPVFTGLKMSQATRYEASKWSQILLRVTLDITSDFYDACFTNERKIARRTACRSSLWIPQITAALHTPSCLTICSESFRLCGSQIIGRLASKTVDSKMSKILAERSVLDNCLKWEDSDLACLFSLTLK